MRISLFENQKNALIFGGVILLGTLVLIGEEDDEGALTSAANQSAYESQVAARAPVPSGADVGIREYVANGSADSVEKGPGWANDSSLVDDASGTDPTPSTVTPSSGSSSNGNSGAEIPPGIDGPGT